MSSTCQNRAANVEMEYFRAEEQRLKKEFDKIMAKIEPPPQKEYFPNVFTSLEPYAQLHPYDVALHTKTQRQPYMSRNTSVRLVDPVVSFNMDRDFMPPTSDHQQQQQQQQQQQKSSGSVTSRSSTQKDSTPRDSRQNTARSAGSCGSTNDGSETARTPLFPTVTPVRNEFTGKSLDYAHVPRLREEINKSYSANAERQIEQSYKLTKNEFYQRQLHRMDEYHPTSRPRMRDAYFAYLQNNPGSARAVKECIEDAEKKMEEQNAQKEDEKQGNEKQKSSTTKASTQQNKEQTRKPENSSK